MANKPHVWLCSLFCMCLIALSFTNLPAFGTGQDDITGRWKGHISFINVRTDILLDLNTTRDNTLVGSLTLPDQLIWCGALSGLIAGGFLAFSSFRISIMLFSSLQGAVALAVGLLALLNDYPNLGAHVARAVYSNAFFLPMLLLVPTAIGLYFQQKLLRAEPDWSPPE